MEDELREEIEWLEHHISMLEKHIREIEHENYKLKNVIGKTIKSLEHQNSDTRRVIYGGTGGVTSAKNFKSYLIKDAEDS
jgi:prefoldin subunit 5